MKKIRVSVTTDGSGDGSNTAGYVGLGSLYAVQLVDGDLADNVDIVITAEQGDLSIPLLTNANFNTDQMVYPRIATAAVGDGSALTDYAEPLVAGTLKVVIAQGGATKTGAVIFYVREL